MEQLIPNFQEPEVSTALKKLATYSLLIVALPLGSMFLLKLYFFEKFLGYNSSDSILYAAIVAVVLVHMVLALFVYSAWSEDDTSRRLPADPIDKQD